MTMNALPPLAVVGSINLDITVFVDHLPAPGETVARGTLSRGIGGKGANQAMAASRLGGAVRLFGAVGDDADGRWMLEQITSAGIDTTPIRIVEEPSGTALVVVDAGGENQIAVAQGANAEIDVDPQAFGPQEAILTQLEIPMSVVERIAATTTNYLVVNAAPAHRLSDQLLERVDLFIVNESEYRAMPELADARRVVVTYGASGAAFFEDGARTAYADGVQVEAVNTVGAGDSFCAALVLALRSGAGVDTALRVACAVGAAAAADPSSQPSFGPLSTYDAAY